MTALSALAAQVVPLFFYAFEGALAGEIEHYENTVAFFEVGGDDVAVFLLAGSIPDIQFGRFLVQGYFSF